MTAEQKQFNSEFLRDHDTHWTGPASEIVKWFNTLGPGDRLAKAMREFHYISGKFASIEYHRHRLAPSPEAKPIEEALDATDECSINACKRILAAVVISCEMEEAVEANDAFLAAHHGKRLGLAMREAETCYEEWLATIEKKKIRAFAGPSINQGKANRQKVREEFKIAPAELIKTHKVEWVAKKLRLSPSVVWGHLSEQSKKKRK